MYFKNAFLSRIESQFVGIESCLKKQKKNMEVTGMTIVDREKGRVHLGEGDFRVCAAVLDYETQEVLVKNGGGFLDLPALYRIGDYLNVEALALKSLSQVIPIRKGGVVGWKNRDIPLCSKEVDKCATKIGKSTLSVDVEIFHWSSMADLPILWLMIGDRAVAKVLAVTSKTDSLVLTGLIFLYEADLSSCKEFFNNSSVEGEWGLMHLFGKELASMSREVQETAFMLRCLRKIGTEQQKGTSGKGELSYLLGL